MQNNAHAITNSYWLHDQPLRQSFEKLDGDHETEVLVIGAGITGLSTALELASRRHRVTVCEAEHWNEFEQTWDCPVHGGRFAADGKRIYGPSETDLEKSLNVSPRT